jgi:hypothetical protein
MNKIALLALVLACAACASNQTPATAAAPTPPPAAATTTPTPPSPAPAAPVARAASTGGRSPHETTSGYVGGDRRTGTLVTITYGRPFTIKPGTTAPRKIWGGLVPWDKADRLGSDEATLLVTPLPLVVGNTTVPAGAYTLYIVPSENGPSKLAFSTNIGKWGVPVDEKHDLARFDLKKESLKDPVDQLTISVANNPPTPNGGVIKISWETTEFSLPFTVQK